MCIQQLGLAVDQRHQLCLVGPTGETGVDLVHLRVERVHLTEECDQFGLDRGVTVQFGELREVADGDVVRDVDRALVGRFLAEDQLDQRRLTGTVTADEPDLVVRAQFEVDLPEDRDPVIGLGDVLQAYPAQVEKAYARSIDAYALGIP